MKKLFLLALCFSINASGASRGIQIISKDGHQIGSYEKSYALLVGVSDYTAGWPDLNAIPGELSQVETLLKERGFDVTKVMNPNSDSLQDAFEDFVNEHGLDTANRLLFYFAGHGYTRLNNSKGYLVPTDAPSPLKDEKGFIRKAYSMTSLLALARNIEANHALFLFDSCFSGTIFKTRALPDTPPLITAMTSQPVRQFITAGDAGEEVPAKSVFTPAFIDALKYGVGDLNKDGYVTGSELGMHLQSVVSNATGQNPQYGKIKDYDLSRGDFVFLASLTTPPGIQNIVTPQSPTSSSFSIDDITNQANEEKQVKQAWQNKLIDMADAFQQVRGLDQDDVDAGLKINAWQRFQAAFKEDNPYSVDDNEMLSQSRTRITALQREQKQVAQQLASLASDSGGALSSTGKACDVCPEMVLIPAGSFRMGDLNGGGYSREKPVHNVTVSAFAMAKTEVTFAEYDVFARATSRALPKDEGWGRDKRPVINVSWHDAKAYAKWLSNKTGRHFRLPSESEWEYAARAGTETKYSWGNAISCSQARYGHYKKGDCGNERKSVSVGSYSANAFGLYDMHGNVYEWVEDCFHDSYSGAPANGSAWTAGSCDLRVLRGGSWFNFPWNLRSGIRYRFKPDFRYGVYFGIRIAQDL